MAQTKPQKALSSLRLGTHRPRWAAVVYQTFNKLTGLPFLAGPCSWCGTQQAEAEGAVKCKGSEEGGVVLKYLGEA